MESPSNAKLAAITAASAAESPNTARAGQYSALLISGARAMSQSDCSTEKRDKLP